MEAADAPTESRESMRLFLAVQPSASVARVLLRLARSLPLPDHRGVPLAQVHLTLLFLGNTPQSKLGDISSATIRVCASHRSFPLCVDHLGTLPGQRPPRLLAALCRESVALYALHRELDEAISEHIVGRKPGRITPHLTLCRFGRGARVHRLSTPVEPLTFTVTTVAMMESVLSPEGAQHMRVMSAPLIP